MTHSAVVDRHAHDCADFGVSLPVISCSYNHTAKPIRLTANPTVHLWSFQGSLLVFVWHLRFILVFCSPRSWGGRNYLRRGLAKSILFTSSQLQCKFSLNPTQIQGLTIVGCSTHLNILPRLATRRLAAKLPDPCSRNKPNDANLPSTATLNPILEPCKSCTLLLAEEGQHVLRGAEISNLVQRICWEGVSFVFVGFHPPPSASSSACRQR